eukprot:364748-Chlamydomonas_euryale.AAC.2
MSTTHDRVAERGMARNSMAQHASPHDMTAWHGMAWDGMGTMHDCVASRGIAWARHGGKRAPQHSHGSLFLWGLRVKAA